MTMSTRKFGIELEVITLAAEMNMGQLADYLTENGIPCRSQDYNHVDSETSWKVVPDGSVHGGCEVVSPILSGERGIEQCKKVAKLLRAKGIYTDRSCGFHVHVDARDMNAPSILNVVKRYNRFESVIDSFMAIGRRVNNNSYCQSNSRVIGSSLEAAVSNNPMGSTAIRNSNLMGSRYYKVNLAAIARHNTIEFRQHAGTTDAEKIEHWIRFCVNFVETSIVSVSEQTQVPASVRTETYSENAWEECRAIAPYSARANDVRKKYAAIAAAFVNGSNRHMRRYVTYSELKAVLGLSLGTDSDQMLGSYMARFRAYLGTSSNCIRLRRSLSSYFIENGALESILMKLREEGYITGGRYSTVERTREIPVPARASYTIGTLPDDSWYRGLPLETKTFFMERINEMQGS